MGDDLAVEERHRLALPHLRSVDGRVADRPRHLDAVRAVRDLAHLRGDLGRILGRVEGHERGHPLRDVVGRDDVHVHVRVLRRLLGRQHDVLVVREDDDRARVRLADRAEQVFRRRVHRRAAAQHRGAERPRDSHSRKETGR